MRMYVVAVDAEMAKLLADGGIHLHSTIEEARDLAKGFESPSGGVRPRKVFEVEVHIKVTSVEAVQP